jgi:hypothetical protein
VIPELTAACIAAAGAALLYTGWRMEAATIPTPAPDQEGTDDGAEALPAEDL